MPQYGLFLFQVFPDRIVCVTFEFKMYNTFSLHGIDHFFAKGLSWYYIGPFLCQKVNNQGARSSAYLFMRETVKISEQEM